MSERVPITLSTSPASPANPGPRTARLFIAGQTALGPVDGPVQVSSLAEYVQRFGTRTGGAAMYDTAELFMERADAGPMVVMRATGPAAVKASVAIGSGAVTVTARNPGAAYNAWTVAWTAAGKTLTVTKGAATVTYSGADAAALAAQAASDPDVTVTATSLPGSDVAATPLAGGTDDFANVVWANVLALIPDSAGPGAVACPGQPYTTVGSALAAHAKASRRRVALVSTAAAATRAQAETALATAAGYVGGETLGLVWPWVQVSDGFTGTKQVDPVAFAAAVRAVAHRTFGVGVSALQRVVASQITGVRTVVEVPTDDWDALRKAHGIVLRNGLAGAYVDNWETVAPPGGNSNLYDLQFRDIVAAVASDAADVCERYVGRPASAAVLAQATSELNGVCAAYADYLRPEYRDDGSVVHPGWKARAHPGINLADNRITAAISLRFVEYADFVDLTISGNDAGATI